MPLDDSLVFTLLRGLLALLRFFAEVLLDYILAWIGKGVVYAVTFGTINLDLDDTREYIVACAAGLVAGVVIALGACLLWEKL